MFLILSAILFGIFALNVTFGAFGSGSFMGDIPEMLTLFAATIAFVAAILRREADEKKQKSESKN